DSNESEIIGLYGPITLKIPEPTNTNIPTVTRTPYPTRTPFYRTPTRAYYRSATPAGAPTQVRTFGPSPTGGTKPAFVPSPTSTITPYSSTGYPSEDEPTPTEQAYPVSEDQANISTQIAGNGQGTSAYPTSDPNYAGSEDDQSTGGRDQTPARVVHLLIGLVTGLALLLGTSVIIAKSFFM
ncbi:MAG: hypothetical protein ACOCYU_05240, partial [Brevefilum sp.]